MSGSVLMAQATGQGAFPLTPVGESEFIFDLAGINMLFDAVENTVKLSQSGMVNVFKRGDLDNPDVTPKVAIELTEAQLQNFEGEYKSETFPLDVKVFIENSILMGQATGQGSFPLTAIGESEFIFKPAGINMKFDTSKGSMTLSQGGLVNEFKR